MRTTAILAVFAGILVSAEQSVWGQASPSSRGTTSSASSLGIGSSMFGTASGGGAGGGGATAGGIGASGFGSSFGSAGGQSGGQTGFGQTGQQRQGQAGAANAAFLGANTAGGFIGRSTQGQTGNFQNAANQNRGGNNRGGGGQNQNLLNLLGGMGGGGNQGGQTSTAPAIRPRQKVAFDYPQPSPTRIQASFQRQLTGISRRFPQFQDVDSTPGIAGEVVLTGTVPTERDAQLAANLARLEPGVRTVRNELKYPPVAEAE